MKQKKTHIFKKEPNEFYIEPRWCANRLFEAIAGDDSPLYVHDPFCGSGRILDAAKKAGFVPTGSDIVERSDVAKRHDFDKRNFFKIEKWSENVQIVSNPPFLPWKKIVEHSSYLGVPHVTLLLPYNVLFGRANIEFLDKYTPETVWRLAPRPPMPPGRMILNGYKPQGGRVDYVWMQWNFTGWRKGDFQMRYLFR